MCTGAMKHVCLAWCSMLFKFTAGRAGRVPAAAAHAPSHCRPPLQSPASNSVCQMWMLLSSLALAKRWGSVGDQATELTVPLCPSSASRRSPAGAGRGGRCRAVHGRVRTSSAGLGSAHPTSKRRCTLESAQHSRGRGRLPAGPQQQPHRMHLHTPQHTHPYNSAHLCACGAHTPCTPRCPSAQTGRPGPPGRSAPRSGSACPAAAEEGR